MRLIFFFAIILYLTQTSSAVCISSIVLSALKCENMPREKFLTTLNSHTSALDDFGVTKIKMIVLYSIDLIYIDNSTFDNSYLNHDYTYYLTMNNCNLVRIDENGFTKFPILQTLNLQNNHLQPNNLHFLNTLYKLQFLDLSNNKIEYLPIDYNSTSLLSLNLGFNNISKLVNSSFIGLPILTVLNLTNCQIETLEINAFKGLFNLNTIDLENNKITHLPSFLFNDTRELKELYLNFNKLSVIGSNAFFGLNKLQKLDFNASFQDISILHENMFNGLMSLDYLDLSSNGIQHFETKVFYNLPKVNLILRNNSITDFPCYSFPDDSQVLEIDLYNNMLTEIRRCAFYNLKNLQVLALKRNYIHTIETGAFEFLQKLIFLDLSYNKLISIDERLIHPLSSLEILYLNNNRLNNSDINEMIIYSPKLSIIDFRDNYWHCRHLRATQIILRLREIRFYPGAKCDVNKVFQEIDQTKQKHTTFKIICMVGVLVLSIVVYILIKFYKRYKLRNTNRRVPESFVLMDRT